MRPARLWHGGQLLAGWSVGVCVLACLRWGLVRGVYRTRIEEHEIHRVGGLWSAELATLITMLSAGIVLGVLAGLTASWMLGRSDRAALRANTVSVHRRILM